MEVFIQPNAILKKPLLPAANHGFCCCFLLLNKYDRDKVWGYMKILPHNYINGSVEYVGDKIVAFGPKQQSESSERNIMFLIKHCHNAFSLYINFSTVTRSINRQDRLSSGI